MQGPTRFALKEMLKQLLIPGRLQRRTFGFAVAEATMLGRIVHGTQQ